ncbi:MAG: TrkA family potassium uptake protein [Selenomonadaceae bacterium]|nr:TrkA family potassium uptake protein [Selenomonadaceae bacterium]
MAKKNFAVFGLGRFGMNVALTLEEMGYDVLGVDKDENVVANLSEKLTRVVSFDIRDVRALKEAGIDNFDTVIIASKNLESSLMATMLCNEMNVSEIVVKAIDERHAKMAQQLGATQVIFSERDTARRVAINLVSTNSVDFISVDVDINILSLDVPPQLVGKNLIESNLRAAYNVNLVAIAAKSGEKIVTPPPQRKFVEGDKIFVIGTAAALSNFERAFEL